MYWISRSSTTLERRKQIMTKVITLDGQRYALPDGMPSKDVQALAGFLITLTKVDSEWSWSSGDETNWYYPTTGASISVEDMVLTTRAEAKTKSATARADYEAKKLAKERAEAGDLVGLHVNQ
jgi:hypothetical protein